MQTFEHAFVINIPFRLDRVENFESTIPKTYLPEVTVWPAVVGDLCNPPDVWKAGNGAWGCYKTHLNILEYCLNNRIGSYIVFEDDAQFKSTFDEELKDFLTNLPDDWQQIYLGGQMMHSHSHPPVKINEHVYRPFNVNRTHAFAVSARGMLPIYQHICNLPFHDQEHIDHHLGRWHEIPSTKVYCPPKWLVGQMGFTSNVSGKDEPVTFYPDPCTAVLKHKLYDNPICIVYRGSSTLLRQAQAYLHVGNQVDSHGYDITLSQAVRYADPLPEINRWYQWIRSEIVRGNTRQLPCMNHPLIKCAQLEALGIKTLEIFPHTLQDIKDICSR